MTGEITQYIDVPQLLLYAFWIFWFGLVFYLRREDKREGYPLETDPRDRRRPVTVQGLPPVPKPKSFLLPSGETVYAPRSDEQEREIAARPYHRHPGAPLEPTGDPMVDGVGPASYAVKKDHPDMDIDGNPKTIPLRTAESQGWSMAPKSTDPRGMEIFGCDGKKAGTVRDVWLDKAEAYVRYLEVEVPEESGMRNVLVPITFTRIHKNTPFGAIKKVGRVTTDAITAEQFGKVPGIKSSDQVTLAEEDKIGGYFAGGYLYAMPKRAEAWL